MVPPKGAPPPSRRRYPAPHSEQFVHGTPVPKGFRIRLNPEFELQFKILQAKFEANFGPAILAPSQSVSTSCPPPLTVWIETQRQRIVYDLHCS